MEINEMKENLAEAKAALRKFRREHGVKDASEIKDPAILAKFNELTEVYTEAEAAMETARAEKKAAAKDGVGARQYGYGKILDAETGTERELTKQEEKKWRTHARRVAKKMDPPISGSEVEFDADFFAPKVKKVKAEKTEKTEKTEKAEKAPVAEEKTEKVRTGKKVRSKTADDDED